jgi:hypothetical protein
VPQPSKLRLIGHEKPQSQGAFDGDLAVAEQRKAKEKVSGTNGTVGIRRARKLKFNGSVGHVRYVMKMTERFSGFLFATF